MSHIVHLWTSSPGWVPQRGGFPPSFSLKPCLVFIMFGITRISRSLLRTTSQTSRSACVRRFAARRWRRSGVSVRRGHNRQAVPTKTCKHRYRMPWCFPVIVCMGVLQCFRDFFCIISKLRALLSCCLYMYYIISKTRGGGIFF